MAPSSSIPVIVALDHDRSAGDAFAGRRSTAAPTRRTFEGEDLAFEQGPIELSFTITALFLG
jgi:hypothetical protein